VNESKKRCPHLPQYDPSYDSSDFTNSVLLEDATFRLVSSEQRTKPKYFNIANSIIAICLLAFGILGKIEIARRNRKWRGSLTVEGRFFLNCQRNKQQATEEWLNENTTSLFTCQSIPKSVRWGVPCLLVLNMGLYLGGHLGLLSVVNLDVTLAGQQFTINNFLEFRFFESTKATYNNGGAEMIILLWIFTGVWPYVKICLCLFIWIVPPRVVGVTCRGSVLIWIDALARLSVIDIFTMILGLGLLLIFIGGRDKASYGEGVYYALKAIVVPKVGCYCIVVAQRMSRVSSQFLLEYHENVVSKATAIHNRMEGDTSISHAFDEQPSHESNSFDGIEPPSISVIDRDDDPSSIENGFSNERSLSGSETGSLSDIPTISICKMSFWKVYRWGHLSAILGGITISIVFVIGCVFAPAIAFDVSSIGGISVESENTFEEAVSEYGVFLVISGILLHARFVLKTKADYIGLGLLLLAAGVTVSLTFIMKAYQFIRWKIRERRQRLNNPNDGKPSFGHEGCGLPSYFRLYKWNHMEIYFISVCIGVWQLGSIVSYSIHFYCIVLDTLFGILTSIGIVEPTEAQCNRIQASLPSSLLITLGSLFILLVTFYLQVSGQYKTNLERATKYVDDKDVPRLSLAWSEDKSKNSRYSHLTESLSLGTDTISSRTGRSISTRTGRSSFITHPPDSPLSSQASRSFRDSPGRNIFGTRSSPSRIQLTSSEDTIEEVLSEDESIRTPVALPISDVGSESSSIIDAPCEVVAPNSLLPRNATATGAGDGSASTRLGQGYCHAPQSLLSWGRPDSNEDIGIDHRDGAEISISTTTSQSTLPPPQMTTISRSAEDTSSITSPKSPPRIPHFFDSSTTLSQRPRRSTSISPSPKFQSTSDFLYQLKNPIEQFDSD